MNNKTYQDIFNYLTTLTYPTDYNDDSRKTHLRKLLTQYFVNNNILYRRGRKGRLRVIKQDETEPILYHLHTEITGAHLGIDTVFDKLRERYYWPQMFKDIRNMFRSAILVKEEDYQKKKNC